MLKLSGRASARLSAGRVLLEAPWTFFDFAVTDNKEVDPSWVPRSLPSTLNGAIICAHSYVRFLNRLIDERRAEQTSTNETAVAVAMNRPLRSP